MTYWLSQCLHRATRARQWTSCGWCWCTCSVERRLVNATALALNSCYCFFIAAQGDKGTATDKLRLVLVYLLTAEAVPSEDDFRPVEAALRAFFNLRYTLVLEVLRFPSWRLTQCFRHQRRCPARTTSALSRPPCMRLIVVHCFILLYPQSCPGLKNLSSTSCRQ